MIDYRAFEEQLFTKWQFRSQEMEDGDEFVPDGLLYRGDFFYDEWGNWERRPGDEVEKWTYCPMRLLIITKDLNDEEPWDIRAETGRKNSSGKENVIISASFYKNLMRWAYGLLIVNEGKAIPSFEAVNQQDVYQPFYDEKPIARINCKKQLGGSSISPQKLKSYLNRYQDLLLEQIRFYDADILLCCGGSDLIKDFIQENYLPDLVYVNDWMYYSISTNKLVVNSWHPCYRNDTHQNMYEEMMANYGDFLGKYPQFIYNHR